MSGKHVVSLKNVSEVEVGLSKRDLPFNFQVKRGFWESLALCSECGEGWPAKCHLLRTEGILSACFKGRCRWREGREPGAMSSAPQIACRLSARGEDAATRMIPWQLPWTSRLGPKEGRDESHSASV